MKTYEFDDFRKMHAFLNEVLGYQEQVGHHGKITVDHREIIIEVYTHDVNDVTELDQEYVQSVDLMHQDVQHYFLTDEGPNG
jgi:pterin-4a-carbinolamine dehydratase